MPNKVNERVTPESVYAEAKTLEEVEKRHGTDAFSPDEFFMCSCLCASSLTVTFLPNGFNSLTEPAVWLQIGRPGKKHRDVLLAGDDLRAFHAKLSEMLGES